MASFIANYGQTIMYTIVSAIIAAIGTYISKKYKNQCDERTKHEVAETCVKAVQQLYKELSGPEKFHKAEESIIQMLSIKGITITELETRMLIESACNDLGKNERITNVIGDK